DPLVALLRTSTGKSGARPGAESSDTLAEPAAPSCTLAPFTPRASPEIPEELLGHPRYRVLGLLGAGGMGAVFKAEHRLMERVIVLKVIHKHFTDRPAAVERFRLEVKAAARLSHPNIVTAHDADQAGDVHFLVMEFVDGTSLDRLVHERGPLPVAEACAYVRQAALGLQHAFERGMVHRDLKPANLMLTPEGKIKILDFGLARFASESGPSTALTEPGTVVDTPDYMAPEQALDPRQADIRSDIYSLGCTLYYLLTGHPPFPEGTVIQKLMAHQERRPKPVSASRADVPAELAQVLDRMLARDPEERYQTPAEVARALSPFAQPTGPAPTESFPAAPRPGTVGAAGAGPKPWRTTFKWFAHRPRQLLTGAAVLATVVGLVVTWDQSLPRKQFDRSSVARPVPSAAWFSGRTAGKPWPPVPITRCSSGTCTPARKSPTSRGTREQSTPSPSRRTAGAPYRAATIKRCASGTSPSGGCLRLWKGIAEQSAVSSSRGTDVMRSPPATTAGSCSGRRTSAACRTSSKERATPWPLSPWKSWAASPPSAARTS
ncbi:MAG: serine/threonine protein kinase, partial [Planctomycetota bacterium]